MSSASPMTENQIYPLSFIYTLSSLTVLIVGQAARKEMQDLSASLHKILSSVLLSYQIKQVFEAQQKPMNLFDQRK